MADKEKKGAKKKKLGKKEQEKLAEEEAKRKAEEEEKKKAEEEEKRKAEEEEKKRIEEEEKRKEEERLRLIEEEKQKLAEKIVQVDEEEEEKEEVVKEEEKLYEYNGKLIKPTLVKSDITNNIKNRAFQLGFEALSKFTSEKEMSEYVKKIFDNEFEPEWQIVIGKDFSVAFSFEIENFIFFQIEDYYFLYYKL